LLLGFFLLSLDAPESVEHYRESIEKEPTNQTLLFNAARYFSKKGFPEDAENTYRKLLSLNPQHNGAKLGLAYILLWQEREGEAKEIFEEILQKNPKDTDARVGLSQIQLATPPPRKSLNLKKNPSPL
ncbi:tetratricopeptide repeat protein, partial [Bdellovibrionota bacterium]